MAQRLLNPNDWYWQADDGRLFASARGAVVTSADADFQAFLASGGSPSFWPKDANGNQTDISLQDALTPYGLFASLKTYAAAKRYEKEIAGANVGGVVYPSDRETQAKLTAAALFAQVDNTQTFRWKLANGSFTDALTAAQVVAVAAAVGGYVNGCFAIEQSVGAQIDAGTITTRAQVDAAFAA